MRRVAKQPPKMERANRCTPKRELLDPRLPLQQGRREALGLPPLHWFTPRSASVERKKCALPAAPGIAPALCGSVVSSSQGFK